MAEKGFFIATLPRDGVVTFLAMVTEKELKPKRNGGIYLHLVLTDRTGELDAKIWDSPEATSSLFQRDDIVKVRGTIELYNDRPQLIVQRIRRCEDGEFQEADFCPTSARDPEEMFVELRGFAESVVNEHVRALLQSILAADDDDDDDPAITTALKVAPAAMKLHHAYRSGLRVMWTVVFLGERTVSIISFPSFRLHHFILVRPSLSSNVASTRLQSCGQFLRVLG